MMGIDEIFLKSIAIGFGAGLGAVLFVMGCLVVCAVGFAVRLALEGLVEWWSDRVQLAELRRRYRRSRPSRAASVENDLL